MSGFKWETRKCPSCARPFEALEFWSDDSTCGTCATDQYRKRLAAANEGRSFTINSIGGACPTQAEGVWVDGRSFYFRARHGDWTLQVSTEATAYGGDEIADGDDPSNGFMEWDDVLSILDAEAAKAVA